MSSRPRELQALARLKAEVVEGLTHDPRGSGRPARTLGGRRDDQERQCRRLRGDTRIGLRLSHKPLQNLVHQLVGGITLVAYPRSHVRLGQWLQIAAFSAPSSHHHWSSDFLGALRDSLG